MKKSLACVLKGHKWDFSYTGGLYRCKFCPCYAFNLTYDYQGKDITIVYNDE